MKGNDYYQEYMNRILNRETFEESERLEETGTKEDAAAMQEQSLDTPGFAAEDDRRADPVNDRVRVDICDEQGDQNEEEQEWFVVQTMSGKEDVLIKYMQVCIDNSYLDDCFIPKRERRKKINGQWKLMVEKIFNGYVFIVTSRSEEVFFALKNVPLLSKILCDGEFTFMPLKKQEIDFIRRIGSGRKDHTARISTVEFGEGDEVLYMQGDLVAFEGMIKKFDKHRRKAVVETEMFGQKTEVWLEFDFLRKK